MKRQETPSTTSDARWWLYWGLAMAALLVVTLPNLGYWPALFQDEMQIIDYGRVVWNPGTSWSMGWLLDEARAMWPISYLGVALQEAAYRSLQPSSTGARVASVFGAVIASGVVFGWLRSRETPSLAALMLALLFFLDPIFNQSYRQGRVDSWTIAACIAACWALRHSAIAATAGRGAWGYWALAGAFTALSPFIWPSAIGLFPLIMFEFLNAVRKSTHSMSEHGLKPALKTIRPFVLAALAVGILCLLPIASNLEQILTTLAHDIRLQKAGAIVQFSIPGMYVLRDPWLIPVILLSLVLVRDWTLLIAMAIALAMMFQTMIYPNRILYLLPYHIAIIASAITSVYGIFRAPRRRVYLGLTLAWALGGNLWISAIERPRFAEELAKIRPVEAFEDSLRDHIGAGSYRVITTEWDLYYAARALGWETYLPFEKISLSNPKHENFLRSMDFGIIRESYEYLKPVRVAQLERAGFVQHATLKFPRLPHPGMASQATASTGVYPDLIIYRFVGP